MSEKRPSLTRWEIGIRGIIADALRISHGNLSQASRWLGISYPTVRNYAKIYGLHPWDADKAKLILQ